MEKHFKKKHILSLITLQVVFLIVFVIAFYNEITHRGTLGIMGSTQENFIIMGFSFLSMINVIVELVKTK